MNIKYLYILPISLITFNILGEVRIGRTKQAEKPSIQQECPDAFFWNSSGVEYEEYFYPLRNRVWTKHKLDNSLGEITKCLDPNTGPNFVYVWDKNRPQFPYSSILLETVNQNWVCRTSQPGESGFASSGSRDRERAALEIYQCHKRAGWPTATDYAPTAPKSEAIPAPKPAAVPAPEAILKFEPKSPVFSATSREEQLKLCQNEPSIQGLKGDQRINFLNACLSKYTNTRNSNGLNQGASNIPSENNSSAKKKVAQLAQKCVSVKPGSVQNTGISTETATLLNSCNEEISYLYCVDSSNGGGHFSCQGQNFGAGDIKARGSDLISVISANNPLRIHWFACTEGGGLLTSQTVRYENGAMRGTCR